MKTIQIEIPAQVLIEAGFPVPLDWDYPCELHVDLDFYSNGDLLEGTIDGTWKDDFDPRRLPAEWLQRIHDLAAYPEL